MSRLPNIVFILTDDQGAWALGRETPEIITPNLDRMIEFGNKIAKNFHHVRVDFYELEGRMYFSEITLYHGAGYNKFHPEEYEKTYAEMLQI